MKDCGSNGFLMVFVIVSANGVISSPGDKTIIQAAITHTFICPALSGTEGQEFKFKFKFYYHRHCLL